MDSQLRGKRIYLSDIKDIFSNCDDLFIKTNKKEYILNYPFSFDIETSSFKTDEGEKVANMYSFVFCIGDKYITGRKWEEFKEILLTLSDVLCLSVERRIIVYIHNLSYEFQFMRNRLEWDKIFALEERKPVQCISTLGIEFRCSFLLSGYSLEYVGKHLQKYKVEKMVGDLDYSLIRHSETPLTDKEWKYQINDGLVVVAYIMELIENCGNITKIPLTKTGFVRNFCRKNCLPPGKKNKREYAKYYRDMQVLKIGSLTEYTQLKRAFTGGFTHANALYTGVTIEDVTSWDYTSSYPSVMVCEMFPMGKGRIIQIKGKSDFERYLKTHCCIFDITFFDIQVKTDIDAPLSLSKCWNVKGRITDNGRVAKAEEITTTLTNPDFDTMKEFYSWKKIRVANFRIYPKAYLPKPFVLSILELYEKKTTLKNVEGMETEYLQSKENLNSCYGMTVTDICRSEIEYNNGEWKSEPPDFLEVLQKNNDSRKRFLFYPWGVFVTAYARRNLLHCIRQIGNDYIYSDTDSMKIKHSDRHKDVIDNYNKLIVYKMKKACDWHGIPFEKTSPKTVEGKTKQLGVFDFDGHYKRFKTLGAKRYFVEYDNGNHSFTISGANKKTGIPYMEKMTKEKKTDIFKLFADELYFPPDYSGRKTHTYIDYPQSGKVTDYLGNVGEYDELSSVHIENSEYTLSLSDEYVKYILGYREKK